MGIRDRLTKAYLRSPGVRVVGDPLIRNRGTIKREVDRRGKRGERIVRGQIKRFFGGKRRKRR